MSVSPSSSSISDHSDFYGWDGSFLRSVPVPGAGSLASVDGHYFVTFNADSSGKLWNSSGRVIRDFDEPTVEQGMSTLNWAADGDYFCGLESHGAGYSVVVEDVAGRFQHFPLDLPADVLSPDGLRFMSVECSLTSHRALISGDFDVNGVFSHTQVALMSLPDGHEISDVRLDTGSGGGSPDLHWYAAFDSDSAGWHTEIIDLTDGTISGKLDGYFQFAPDSHHVVGTDGHGVAAVVDWRTKAELWKGPGHLVMVMASADPSTNMMLLWLSTGQTQGGTDTYDYWIVDGTGNAHRFDPRDCTPIEVSPTRLCWSS
ncbi:MAG TPA: hypothetical protein VFB69_03280 [Candidatus Dormibacteraeota bacterium]|nr:hypothetical protein [Candidatus Dormibacteraeota bacterium]